MQYAFVTLALTAATLAMPTKREALGGLDNIVNVGAVTSGLPVVSGLGLGVKRSIVENTLPGGVSGTVDSVKDTVNGVKVGVQARDLVNGLVGGGLGGTVNSALDTVGGLNVLKRSVVDQVKDIVNNVNVDVATKRDVLNGLLGDNGVLGSLGLGETVGGVVKRDALVDNLLSGVDLDSTLGNLNLPIVQRDLPLVGSTATPLLNTVTDTVDSIGLGLKRDTSDALNLGSGSVGSVLGGNSGNADKTLGLNSGLVGGVTNGLNLGNTVDNVVKRDSGNALNLGSGAVGSVLGSGKSDETLNLGSGTVGGATDGLNVAHVLDNVVKRDSGNALNLGSGSVGSVLGGSSNSDEALNLGSGTVGGAADGLNVAHILEKVVKRQSGDVLGLASGSVGGLVGAQGDSSSVLGLKSGTAGGLTDGLNVAHIADGIVKRQSGDVLGLASGSVGGLVGAQGDSSSVLGLKSGTAGGLTDGLNVAHIADGVVKRQSGDVLGLASGSVGGLVGAQGDSSSVLDLNSGTVGGLMDGLSLNHITEGVIKRSIQELDVHSLIASLSDEQIKQLTAVLPSN